MCMIKILEVCRRSEQGATQPFLCYGEDGFLYWVKGKNIDDYSRCAEWLAAQLGQALDLPIPKVELVKLDSSIVNDSFWDNINILGKEIAFGSRNVEYSIEFESQFVKDVPLELQRKIFLFDFILRNTDRTFIHQLGSSGNPNLLWADGRVHVIDHNNAFLVDDMFNVTDFNRHIFISALKGYDFAADLMRMQTTLQRLWEKAAKTLPQEWQSDATILSRMKQILEVPFTQLQQKLKRLQEGVCG